MTPGQFVPELHYLVIDRQQAVLDGFAAGALMKQIGQDAVIVLESTMHPVERRRHGRGLQGLLDLRKGQTNGGGDLKRIFRAASLCEDQHAGVPKPIHEQHAGRDDNKDAS